MRMISMISAGTLLVILGVIVACVMLFTMSKWMLYIAIAMMIGLFKSIFAFLMLAILLLIVYMNLSRRNKEQDDSKEQK
jgi:membrane protein implicated in regulation of membrane protease activity